MNEKPMQNYGLFVALLASLSLGIPLIVIDAPFWVISIVSLAMFLPYIIPSTLTFFSITTIYAILLRPGLYIWGLIATINGPQDFIAIAFYIVAGLQAFSIIKNCLYYILVIISSTRVR